MERNCQFPVEEGGTIQAEETQTRWNRYHNIFLMNMNTPLDIEVRFYYQLQCTEDIAKLNHVFYM